MVHNAHDKDLAIINFILFKPPKKGAQPEYNRLCTVYLWILERKPADMSCRASEENPLVFDRAEDS